MRIRKIKSKLTIVILMIFVFIWLFFFEDIHSNKNSLLEKNIRNIKQQMQQQQQQQQQQWQQQQWQPNQIGNFTCDLIPFNERFGKLIESYADEENVIILAVTDLGYVQMALNLYESSFKRFNIDNYLFLCSHEKAEQFLTSRNIHAISLWNDSFSEKESLYGKEGYRNKTNFKTDSVYLSLCLGYTTLLVDVDIVFLQNPLPYLMQFSTEYDLIIQNEYHWINSGWFIFRKQCITSVFYTLLNFFCLCFFFTALRHNESHNLVTRNCYHGTWRH